MINLWFEKWTQGGSIGLALLWSKKKRQNLLRNLHRRKKNLFFIYAVIVKQFFYKRSTYHYLYIYRLLEIEAHENMLRNSFKCELGGATSVWKPGGRGWVFMRVRERDENAGQLRLRFALRAGRLCLRFSLCIVPDNGLEMADVVVQIRFFDFGFFWEVPDPEIGVRPLSIHKLLFFGNQEKKVQNRTITKNFEMKRLLLNAFLPTQQNTNTVFWTPRR